VVKPSSKLRIIVGGMVGAYPLGGVAWDYFHYVLALHELGHDVYYHEDTWSWPYHPLEGGPTEDPSYTVGVVKGFFDRYAPHLKDRWHYLHLHEKSFGMTREAFDDVAKSADVFLNVSGACFFPDNLNPKVVKVFMDTDPGYNQIVMHEKPAWSSNVDRWVKQVREHDRHLTYAENIYAPDCLIPRMDIDWRPTRCVVTLPSWADVRNAPAPTDAAFSTIMSWSYFKGDLVYRGVKYEAKAPEYEKFHDLPKRVNIPLTLAVGGWHQPVEKIKADGWTWIDARTTTTTAAEYVDFIQQSRGEWSVAKNVYVATNSGWFSCRTACYLAAGRPAVVQETGWSRYVPAGQGVLTFVTMQDAINALNEVHANYAHHRARAYDIAREYLAPDRVLPPMLETIFSSARRSDPSQLPPSVSAPTPTQP